MKRLALLSMDVEDWYHLEYFPTRGSTWSMLDGLDRFAEWLDAEGVPGTFFCLGELVPSLRPRLRELVASGHEIASHGPDHALPSTLSTSGFVRQMRTHKAEVEDRLGLALQGYRAPCFALDREKLEALEELGFSYDSSVVDFATHPLYGRLQLADWEKIRGGVRRAPSGGLVEFEIPLGSALGLRVPIAGGGYFRMFPWAVTRRLLGSFLTDADVYVFYIHPFECSSVAAGSLPPGTRLTTRFRFSVGRRRVMQRLPRLVALLREHGFTFVTFSDARRELCRDAS